MSVSISFLELSLGPTRVLEATLGSGPLNDVLSRNLAQPFLRLCMQDPSVVDYRVRSGTVRLTDHGLDYSNWDEFQSRGASLRFFGYSFSIIAFLASHQEFIRNIVARTGTAWLGCFEGQWQRVGADLAIRDLMATQADAEIPLLVQFQIPDDRIDELLALLAKSCTPPAN